MTWEASAQPQENGTILVSLDFGRTGHLNTHCNELLTLGS